MFFSTGAQLQAALNALPASKVGNYVAFDAFWYGQTYMKGYAGNLSPIDYFVQVGAARGDKPNPSFDPAFYANQYADIRGKGYDAADLIYHFMKYGMDEGRAPSAAMLSFNSANYLALNPDVVTYINANLSQFGGSMSNGAIAHYIKFGQFEGRSDGTPLTAVKLTTGIDNANAGQVYGSLAPFYFDGIGPTLNSGDTIVGSSTNPAIPNTLTVGDSYGEGSDIMPVGVTLTNVQNVTLNTSGNAGQLARLDPTGATSGAFFSTASFPSVVTTIANTLGASTDGVQAANASTIAVNHMNVYGGVATQGGSDVTVTTNGNGGVSVGGFTGGTSQSLPTGNIKVNANGYLPGAANVNVVGGKNVTVNVAQALASGSITIGNVAGNTGWATGGALTAGSNPTGAVSITSNSIAGASNVDTVFGGTTVSVNVKGDTVVVGDVLGTAATGTATPTNNPTDNVTIVDNAQVAYDGLSAAAPGAPHNRAPANISVYGGKDVSVTTNAGGVTVGTAAGTAGTLPKGNVTVVSTANDKTDGVGPGGKASISVYGGVNVSVTAADDPVTIGATKSLPTGTVSVTESAASTRYDVVNGANAVTINGGNGVTVSAQGQNVSVGATNGTAGAQVVTQSGVYTGAGLGGGNGQVVVDGGSTVAVTTTGGNVTVGAVVGSSNFIPTGAVTIADNFGAGNATNDAISVLGGTTVGITIGSANKGAISVGAAPVLTADGTALRNAALSPTGDVTIANFQVNGTKTTYGTGATNVATNGAATVSITGGNVQSVTDVQSTLATGGAGFGKAVGTSTLATVIIDGAQTAGAVAIQSDALTKLSILDNSAAGKTFNVTNNGTTDLALTVGNNSKDLTINDPTATSLTVGDNGKASAGKITFFDAKLASLTANNTAALSLVLTGDAKLAKITANNTGALDLGDVSTLAKLASIDATKSTGAVTVTIDPTVTLFNAAGSTGADTVTITANKAANPMLAIAGSTNTGNVLVANYQAQVGDVALATKASNFGTLEVAGANAGSLATGANHTYQAGSAAIPAVAQIDTITIGGTSFVAGNTFSETIGANTYTYTVKAGDTVNNVAAGLAAAILTSGTSGVAVTYVTGPSFTLTAPVAGTGFTASSAVSTAANTGTGTFTAAATPGAPATAQVDTITWTGAAGAGTATVTIGAAVYNITTVVGEPLDAIAGALATLINGDLSAVVTATTAATGQLILTAKTPGVAFTATPGATGGTLLGTDVNTIANVVGTNQVDTFVVNTPFTAGNTITLNVNGGTMTYTVGALDLLTTDVANDLVIAINGGVLAAGHGSYVGTIGGVTGSAVASTVSITYNTKAATHAGDTATIANGGNGTATTTVTTPNQAFVPAVPADASYDASGFTGLMVGATNAGWADVNFINVATGTPLQFVANQGAGGVTNYMLKDSSAANDTLNLTVGTSSTKALSPTVLTSGVENLVVTSTGKIKDGATVLVNNVTIGDTAAQTLAVKGDQNVVITLKDSANTGVLVEGVNASVTSIDASGASGAVDVTAVALKNASAHTITGGSGVISAKGGTNISDNDTFTSGTGGAKFEVGKGGAWGQINVSSNYSFGTGSETINLSASTGSDTLFVPVNVVSTFSGTKGGVTGFGSGITGSDKITFGTIAGGVNNKTVVANVAAPTVVTSLGTAVTSTTNLDPTLTGLFNDLSNVTYTVSNGVITFNVTGGHAITDYSVGEYVSAAEVIVNNAGGNRVAAFSMGGNTYVVTSDAAATLANTPLVLGKNTATSNQDSIIELMGVAGFSGFGTTGAQGTIVSSNVTNPVAPALTNSGTAVAAAYSATGYSHLDQSSFAAGTTSTAITGLAPSSVIDLNGGAAFGALSVSQTGTAGQNSITVNLTAGDTGSLALNGDGYALINGAGTLTALTDSGATLATLAFGNAGVVDVQSITDSALTKIDASGMTGTLKLGDGITAGQYTGISNAGLTLVGGTGLFQIGAPAGTTLNNPVVSGLTGNNVSITLGTAAANNNNANVIWAAGAGDTINVVGSGANTIVANGAGNTITVGTTDTGNVGANTITATGANDTIKFVGNQVGNATVTVGPNANVTFGTTSVGNAESVVLANVVTGAASSGSYTFVTLNNVVTGTADKLVFNTSTAANAAVFVTDTLAGGTMANSLVNVASATTLAQALDLAASVAAVAANPNPDSANFSKIAATTGVIDWFQFGGNTYIVESINAGASAASHSALGTGDVVVKITGLVDLSGSTFDGVHTITL